MKRLLIAALLATSLVVGATVAEAAVSTGKFKGNITDGGKISIKIGKKDGKYRVVRVAWSGVPNLKCEDDGDGDLSDDQTNRGTAGSTSDVFKVSSEGKFTVKISDTATRATRIVVKGKASGSTITGSFRATSKFDTNDNPDPNGTIDCDSGKKPYTATKS